MPEAKGFRETVNFQPINFETGADELANTIANAVEPFKELGLKKLGEAAEKRGKKRAGEVEFQKDDKGITQKPIFMKEGFIGSMEIKAYNETVRDGYLASLSNDVRNSINEIEINNQDNISAFNDSYAKLKEGFQSQVDPELWQEVEIFMDNKASDARAKVQRANFNKEIKDADSHHVITADNAIEDGLSAARQNDNLRMGEARLELDIALDRRITNGQMTKNEKGAAIEDYEHQVVHQQLKGKVLRTAEKGEEGIPNALAMLDEAAANRPDNIPPAKWDAYIKDIQTNLSRKISRVKAEKTVASKQAQKEIKSFIETLGAGGIVSQKTTSRVLGLAEGTDQEDVVNRAVRLQTFSVDSAKDRSQIINDLRATISTTDSTAEQQQDFLAMMRVDNALNVAAQKDPAALWTRQGFGKLPPIDINNPATAATRGVIGESIGEQFNTVSTGLTQAEIKSFSANIPNMAPNEKVAFSEWVNELGPSSEGAYQMFADEGHHVFAIAGAIGDPELASLIFRGQQELVAKNVAPPKKEDFMPVMDDYFGTAYQGVDRQAHREATLALYAALNGTQDPGILNTSNFNAALQLVTGGIGRIDGFDVQLPRSVSESEFQAYKNTIGEDFVEDFGGVYGQTSAEAAKSIREGRPKSIGNNEYLITIHTGELFTEASNGLEKFIFEYDPSYMPKAKPHDPVEIESQGGVFGPIVAEPSFQGDLIDALSGAKERREKEALETLKRSAIDRGGL